MTIVHLINSIGGGGANPSGMQYNPNEAILRARNNNNANSSNFGLSKEMFQMGLFKRRIVKWDDQAGLPEERLPNGIVNRMIMK